MCRDNHPVWKGVACSICDAFFCFRGLYRHFDVDLLTFLRKDEAWTCPKCLRICNCRCCHSTQPYKSKDKPTRARIKPVDSRGRIYGFVDNVFDQKRGRKASLPAQGVSPQVDVALRGQKRPRVFNEDEHIKPWPHNSHVHLPSAGAEAVTDTLPNGRPFVHPGSKGQLRISDLVDDRSSPVETTSTPRSGIAQPPISSALSTPHNGPSYGPSASRDDRRHSEFPSSEDGESIGALQKKRDTLRQYADDLLELALVESHAKVLDTISQLEREIEQRKRAKAERLFDNLNRDFPYLADLAREEARRRGI